MTATSNPGDYPLTSDVIHVWQLNLTTYHSCSQNVLAVLSSNERDRMARFVFDRDRLKFGLCRGLLRCILAGYTQQNPANIAFDYAPEGKPSIPEPLEFNLSHSGDWMVCAVSRDAATDAPSQSRPVGVDVECVSELKHFDLMVERCLTSHEQHSLATLPPEQAQRRFFECWTGKEAYLKAIGQGLRTSLQSVEIATDPPRLQPLSRQDAWQLHQWQPDAHSIASLAYPGEAAEIVFRQNRLF